MSAGKTPPLRQEEDRIKTAKIVAVGVGALITFAIGIWWAVAIQRGIIGTVETRTGSPVLKAGKREIGMVYQPLFDKSISDEKAAPKRVRLDSAGWVDAGKTVAHIPIDRAMELVIRKGKL